MSWFPKIEAFFFFFSPSSKIFCASVQKAMLGSSRWNKAQDLERKLGPWKQASVMWLPCRLIEPPNCTASSGRGIWKSEMWQPAITFSTPGQWRWWAASISEWQRQLGEVDAGQPEHVTLILAFKSIPFVFFVLHVWLYSADKPVDNFSLLELQIISLPSPSASFFPTQKCSCLQSSAAPFSVLRRGVLGGRYGPGPQVERARLLVSNCWVKNSCSFMPILMRSGVVEREMITWKTSHCRSPWTKISLGRRDERRKKVRGVESED